MKSTPFALFSGQIDRKFKGQTRRGWGRISDVGNLGAIVIEFILVKSLNSGRPPATSVTGGRMVIGLTGCCYREHRPFPPIGNVLLGRLLKRCRWVIPILSLPNPTITTLDKQTVFSRDVSLYSIGASRFHISNFAGLTGSPQDERQIPCLIRLRIGIG